MFYISISHFYALSNRRRLSPEELATHTNAISSPGFSHVLSDTEAGPHKVWAQVCTSYYAGAEQQKFATDTRHLRWARFVVNRQFLHTMVDKHGWHWNPSRSKTG